MTKLLKPSQLCKVLPLPAKSAERTVAHEMGLISGYFKKKGKASQPKKNSIFMNSLPKKINNKNKNKKIPHHDRHHRPNNQCINRICCRKALLSSIKDKEDPSPLKTSVVRLSWSLCQRYKRYDACQEENFLAWHLSEMDGGTSQICSRTGCQRKAAVAHSWHWERYIFPAPPFMMLW